MNNENITCTKCGSVYQLEMTRMPVRDKDSIKCVVCGVKLKEWNGTSSWDATLLKRGEIDV